MKKTILSIAACLFISSCTAKTELKASKPAAIDSLVGDWIYYQYSGEQSYTNQTFRLILKKTEQASVYGYYCSTWDSGNRIDCSTEDVNNIKGIFEKDTLYLTFFGFYDDKAKGKAKVYKQKDCNVIWELGKCKGVFYLPKKVQLIRYNADKYQAEIRAIDSLKEKNVVIENTSPIDIKEISLPFDFHQFQDDQDRYNMGEQEEVSYYPVSIEGKEDLERIYKSQWDKSQPSLFYRIHTENKYKLDMVCYYFEGTPSLIYRLITSVDGTIIDGITVFSKIGENREDWNTNSFTLSKNLDVIIYKNLLHNGKIIKHNVVGKYIIDDKGKFIKQ